MLTTFEETTVERKENNQYWVRDRFGNIACEAFVRSEDESEEDMLNNGFVPVPYKFEGMTLYVEVQDA